MVKVKIVCNGDYVQDQDQDSDLRTRRWRDGPVGTTRRLGRQRQFEHPDPEFGHRPRRTDGGSGAPRRTPSSVDEEAEQIAEYACSS